MTDRRQVGAVKRASMITPRGLIELFLLAALVPVVLVGVANWRQAAQPSAAPAPSGPRVRAQLGRFAHPRPIGVTQAQSAESKPAHGNPALRATANERPLHPDAASPGPEPVGAHAMMVARWGDAPRPTRRPEAAPFRSAPFQAAAARSAATAGAVWDAPAVVEFVGISQDQQLLQREEFLADVLKELKIIVWWNVPGTRTQRLELYTPNGSLYKQFTAQFDGDAARARPGGRTAVETRLPVGGTWITEHSLFGAWRVDVYLSGQRTPVTSASFALTS